MSRNPILTILLVFISSIAGVIVGYAPGNLLAALMQGQGTEGVGIAANIMAVGGGILLPFILFRKRMESYRNGTVAAIFFALLSVGGLPISWFMLSDILTDYTNPDIGMLTWIGARFLFVVGPVTVASAVVALGMSLLGVKRLRQEG